MTLTPLPALYFGLLEWKALGWLSYEAGVPLRLQLRRFPKPCGKYVRHGHDWVSYWNC